MIHIKEALADGSVRTLSEKEVRNYGKGFQPYADKRLESIKKDASVPSVGDTVRLNDYGLRQVFGTTARLSHMKALEMVIIEVDELSMTYPEATFIVQVDHPEINECLLDNHCFDIVKRA